MIFFKYCPPTMRYSLLIFTFVFAVHCFAQTEKEEPKNDEVSTSYDLSENDPSLINLGLTKKKQSHQLRRMLSAPFIPFLNSRLKNFKKFKGDYQELLDSHPERFQLFKIHEARYQPQLENGPTLINTDHEFNQISDRSFGYCMGFTTLIRNFETLAFYEPDITTPFEPHSPEWISYYQELIFKIAAGEAVVIPGFQNFRDLSLVPEFELYLKTLSMKLWETRAIRSKSLKLFLNAMKPISRELQVERFLDLKKRSARGEMPKLIFSSLIPDHPFLGKNPDIHSVLVYKLEEKMDGTLKIFIWDIDFYSETLVKEPKFLELSPDGIIHYAPWYEPTKPYAAQSDYIARFEIAPENDEETAQLLDSLAEFCKNENHSKFCN